MRVRGPCCVLGCPNKGAHTFPQNMTLRRKWIEAAKLDRQRKVGWNLRKYSSICSEHFKQSDFIIPQLSSCGVQKTRRLKNNAIPSIFPWTSLDQGETSSSTKFDPNQAVKTYSRPLLPMAFAEEVPFQQSSDITDSKDDTQMDPLKITVEDNDNELGTDDQETCSAYSEIEIEISSTDQVTMSSNCELKQEISKGEKSVQTDTVAHHPFSIHSYKDSDKAIHFFTGLQNYRKVLFVFQTLEESNNLQYFYGSPPTSLTPLDQFFMTLIILRLHKTFEEMSMMYLVPIKQVYNIFITWIRFMALQWRNIDLWVDRETVHAYAPLDFYDKYPMTRVVLDATEFPIKKPKLPLAQQITFSTYKNRNTAKVLIGICPSGLINYVSQCYGGSATDRQIVERSSILNRFDFKDEIMVDKGLNVQDILLGYGVKVNMPSFFKKSHQIDPSTLLADRKVAGKRVHVERVIGMLKTYKILKQPMNKTETMLASDIVYICAMLVNFRSNIIKNSAQFYLFI